MFSYSANFLDWGISINYNLQVINFRFILPYFVDDLNSLSKSVKLLAFLDNILAFLRIYTSCNSVPRPDQNRVLKGSVKKCKKKDSKGWFLVGRPFYSLLTFSASTTENKELQKTTKKSKSNFFSSNCNLYLLFKCAVVLQFANLPISISQIFFWVQFFLLYAYTG